jgi:hypothetical protein
VLLRYNEPRISDSSFCNVRAELLDSITAFSHENQPKATIAYRDYYSGNFRRVAPVWTALLAPDVTQVRGSA